MAVADVAPDHGAEGPSLGASGTRPCASEPRRRKRPSTAQHLVFVSAAGPCGAWLSRSRTKKGDAGWVVAPALRPTKAGDRVHTNRRDARPLARLMRSGALTPVAGPTVAAAASRDLRRARAEPLRALQAATCRRTAFLRWHASRATGRATWGAAPLRWRSEGVWPTPAPPIVLPADGRAVNKPTARLQRLAHARHEQGQAWRLPSGVEALQALRGVPCPVAVPTVAKRGALPRCETPSALRQCVGLLPAAYATGARRRQGARTKAGPPPCPSCSRGRRLGVPLPSQGAAAAPPATGKAPHGQPGPPLAGPRPAVPTLSTPDRPGATGQPGGHGHCAGAGGGQVGHGQPEPGDTLRPKTDRDGTHHAKGCQGALAEPPPRCWCHPRRREEPSGHARP
jgi:hypothetical protein